MSAPTSFLKYGIFRSVWKVTEISTVNKYDLDIGAMNLGKDRTSCDRTVYKLKWLPANLGPDNARNKKWYTESARKVFI